MSQALFTATKLKMLGKSSGKLVPDADGYYELVLGGLETFNNTGIYYSSKNIEQLFGPGSLIQRRIANGCLRSEVNHPSKRTGESDEAFIRRNMDIDMTNTCAHIAELWLDYDFGRKNPCYGNPKLIGIIGKVKPAGDKKHILQEALDNPKENVCFSIRAFADEFMERGKIHRVLTDIMAIDFVNEGGILMASKWDSPKTESIDNSQAIRITEKLITRLKESSKSGPVMATESSDLLKYVVEKYDRQVKQPVYASW